MITVELLDKMGSDLTVVNAARVSFAKQSDSFNESDERLIKYLAAHKHWTPFSQCQVQLRISAPIFVARQAFKSSVGTSRNEISRRYVCDKPMYYTPTEWRSRPTNGMKQGSGEPIEFKKQGTCTGIYRLAIDAAQEAYDNLLSFGVAPEQARMVLPQAMMTEWIETGSLAYWARFYGLRSSPDAQKEIQDLAEKIDAVIAPLFPISWSALCAFAKT
jgi:thymidylate synthase (FAD)